MPFAPPLKVRLLVMQPTPFCNINCDYCYLGQRNLARFMSDDVVTATLRNLVDCGLVGDQLSVIWHAGEPLVAPLAFYRRAFDAADAIVGRVAVVSHSIQTNATLIDDAWCGLFRERRVRIGVSLDGPAFLHDRRRKTRSGAGTHASVMRGIERLRSHGIPFHVIAVVTDETLRHADAFIDFFVENGIRELGVNIDEQEGVNPRSSLRGRDADYDAFLEKLFTASEGERAPLRLRELERLDRLIAENLPRVCVGPLEFPDNEQVLPFAITTVDWQGGFSCFSPELIDQTHPRLGGFVFGNVQRGRILEALDDSRFREIFGEILAGVEQCRAHCAYFNYCGGGSPVNKLNENGSFASDATDYCRKTLQQPLQIALRRVEHELARAHPA